MVRSRSHSRQKNALDSLSTGTYGNQGERIDFTYWDEDILAAAGLDVRLFQVPMGGAKTRDQTNMTQAGMIPQGQKLEVKAIKVLYTSETTGGIKATAADIQAFFTQLARTVVSVKVQGKDTMGEWTLQELMGLSMAVALNPAVTFMPPFPEPRFHCIFPLTRKITLAALTPFYVQVTRAVAPTAATIGDRLKIGLNGILTRIG